MKKKNTRIEEDNWTDQTEHVREEKLKEHNTGSFDINKREANNKGRTDPENGKIRRKTEKQNFRKPNMQIL